MIARVFSGLEYGVKEFTKMIEYHHVYLRGIRNMLLHVSRAAAAAATVTAWGVQDDAEEELRSLGTIKLL